jgi:hypothetical protein
MRGTVRLVVLLVAVTLIGACGGGGSGDDGDGAEAKGKATTTTDAGDAGGDAGGTGTTDSAAEVPAFLGDFERVCTTQVGFPGTTAYEEAPGVHPVVLFEDYRGEGFVQSSRTLPAGWAVTEDTNFKDTSDLAKAQLVACSDRVKETPTGKKCSFEGDKDAKGEAGKSVELELVDATYELKIYEARTGALKSTATLEAHETECPFIATFKTGDKTFVDEPSDDDYTAALKTLVAVGS